MGGLSGVPNVVVRITQHSSTSSQNGDALVRTAKGVLDLDFLTPPKPEDPWVLATSALSCLDFKAPPPRLFRSSRCWSEVQELAGVSPLLATLLYLYISLYLSLRM